MTIFTTKPGARLAAVAFAAAGAIALAGCENPQPTAAPEQATAAPSGPDANLMGAPTGRSPQYVGPSAPAYPPPPPYGQPYPPAAYPPGYGHATGPGAPGQIIAMQPIPNPPENGWYYGRHYGPVPRHHHRHHVWMYGAAAPVHVHHARRHLHRAFHPAVAPAPVVRRAPTHPVAPAHPAPAVHPAAPARHAPAAPTGAAVGAAQLVKPHAPAGHHHHKVDQATSAAAAGGPTNTADNATGNVTGSEADHYKALESSLHDAFAAGAVLTVPATMTPGQVATVSLALPADFADTVQKDAAQQGLSGAAAAMNLLATLTGDGYTITPVEAQTTALAANQATTFQWQVTPGAGAKGPLKANVRAQAVSAGQFLNLGDKVQGDSTVAGKVVGVGLLVLIAALILGWALRRKPRSSAGTVRRPAYDQYPPTSPNV